MYEYKVVTVSAYQIEEEINKLANVGWEFHSFAEYEFDWYNFREDHESKVESYKLIFRKQK